MPLPIPRRLVTTLAGRFGPFAVERHEVDLGGGASRGGAEAVSGASRGGAEAVSGAETFFTLQLGDCVTVAAVTEDGQFVLVRQHRHGIDAMTLETPGGIVDPGEAPEEAALRELREETGYAADALEPLGWVHSNPVLQGNRCFFFLARGAREVGPPLSDGRERTEAVLMDAADVAAAIRDGRISHALAVLALQRALATGPTPREVLRRALGLLDAMEQAQLGKVIDLARRILPHLTAEDLRNPHDFPDMDDPDWHFEDGQLAGIQAVRFALRALSRDLLLDGEAGEGRAGGEGREEEGGG